MARVFVRQQGGAHIIMDGLEVLRSYQLHADGTLYFGPEVVGSVPVPVERWQPIAGLVLLDLHGRLPVDPSITLGGLIDKLGLSAEECAQELARLATVTVEPQMFLELALDV